MKAHERINSASYGPEALKTMTRAFDQAWSVMGGNIGRDASEAARVRLANALLSVATEDSRDVDVLKRKALEAMALSYYAVPSDTFTSDATGHEDAGQQPHLAEFPVAQSWPAPRPAETLHWLATSRRKIEGPGRFGRTVQSRENCKVERVRPSAGGGLTLMGDL